MSHCLSVRQPRIMLALSTFAAFSILVASAADIADFDDEKYGFEYIYHDETDLMITIHDNKCYYTAVTEDSEHYLSSDRHLLFFSSRDLTEKFLRDQIRLNHNETIIPSSLDAMRDQYEDLLADFRCEGREIFHVVFNRTDSHPSQSHGSNHHHHPDGSSR